MRAILERPQPGRWAREEGLLAAHAAAGGLPVCGVTRKAMARGRVPIAPDDVVAGSVPFVRAALQQLGGALPPHAPYPPCLAPWLHRRVWRVESLGMALHTFHTTGQPVFLKPAEGWKRFTGFVLNEPAPPQLLGVSRRLPVWCADPVPFVSEWRAYVAYGRILDLRFADHGGDRTVAPDHATVHAAVAAFAATPGAPAGCALDFGVLATGETALIEANDGFAIGAYDGVAAETLWRVTSARWTELATLARTAATPPSGIAPRPTTRQPR